MVVSADCRVFAGALEAQWHQQTSAVRLCLAGGAAATLCYAFPH